MTRILAVLSVLLVAVFGLAGLERARGAAALSEAQAAEAQGDLPAAIAAARIAAEARVPYTQHADHALDLLERCAERASVSRDPAGATLALAVARQAAEATGQHERAAALAQKEASLLPDGAPSSTRPTGFGRGPVGLASRLGMFAGVAVLIAALGVALGRKGAPLRVCAALSVLGTALLVAARLLA